MGLLDCPQKKTERGFQKSSAPLWYISYLVGGLERFLFSHILGIIIPTNSYFSEGLKPPTRYVFICHMCCCISWQLAPSPASLCYQESQGLPVVLLVGDVSIGQKLLKALGVASSTESKDTALGVIQNKYYSARVQPLGRPKMAGVSGNQRQCSPFPWRYTNGWVLMLIQKTLY